MVIVSLKPAFLLRSRFLPPLNGSLQEETNRSQKICDIWPDTALVTTAAKDELCQNQGWAGKGCAGSWRSNSIQFQSRQGVDPGDRTQPRYPRHSSKAGIPNCSYRSRYMPHSSIHNPIRISKLVSRKVKTPPPSSQNTTTLDVLHSFKQKLPLWSSRGLLAFALFWCCPDQFHWLQRVIKITGCWLQHLVFQFLTPVTLHQAPQSCAQAHQHVLELTLQDLEGGWFPRKIYNLYLLLFSLVRFLAWKKYPVVSDTLLSSPHP